MGFLNACRRGDLRSPACRDRCHVASGERSTCKNVGAQYFSIAEIRAPAGDHRSPLRQTLRNSIADPAARLRACGFVALLVRLRTICSAKLRLRPRQDSSLRIFRLSSSSVAKDLGEKCLLENDRRGLSWDDTRGECCGSKPPPYGHV